MTIKSAEEARKINKRETALGGNSYSRSEAEGYLAALTGPEARHLILALHWHDPEEKEVVTKKALASWREAVRP